MKTKTFLNLHLFCVYLCWSSLCCGKEETVEELEEKWGMDWSFSGISTFAHLPHVRCLTKPKELYDIAIVGAPFDTAVSYRPGARFGPRALRAASARINPLRAYNTRAKLSPFAEDAKIIDCGDIPITPFDNKIAFKQMTQAFLELGSRSAYSNSQGKPKLITLGGDHSLALPALRALRKIHDRPITVLHFDAHLDTWHPGAYPSSWHDASIPTVEQPSAYNHGSMFWIAWKEGLLSDGSSAKNSSSNVSPPNVHAGLRTRLRDEGDHEDDTQQGWVRIMSDQISSDLLGPTGLAERIIETIGTEAPVYLSVDIDVIDPGLAPGTGTPEPGGWTTRELVRVLRAIEGLNVVGADLVEVLPAHDGSGEQTALAGAQVVYEILTSMIRRRKLDQAKPSAGAKVRDEL